MTLPTPRSTRLFAAGCAFAFLIGHLPFLASSLEDVDSVNFALALRRFDVAAHRPHPPGYPVFIGLAKGVHGAVASVMGSGASRDAVDARTLALVGVIFGTLLAFPLLQAFRMLEQQEWRARAAVVLSLACPLLWFNASRPLSDVVGLCSAVVAQALLLTAWRRQKEQRERAATDVDRQGLAESGRLVVLGALVAGIAIGVRVQTAWLTVPLLLFVIGDRAGRGAAGALLGSMITFSVGVLAWAVPLLWVTGGPGRYVAALTNQAGEDLSGVDMLARNPTLGRLLAGLVHTFVQPWASLWLAVPVLVLAAIGMAVMLRRSRGAVVALLAMTVPFALFHLTFHETFTTRYALPLVPAVAYLVACGLSVAGRASLAGGTVVLAVASLAPTVPALAAYASEGSPVARAVADIRQGLARVHPHGRVLVMNHPFSIALRDDDFDADRLASVPRRQWLEIIKYWRFGTLAGGLRSAEPSKPVWFLAEPGPNGLDRHHELTLIDPSARRLHQAYRWPFDPTNLLGGARPSEADWFELREPGWFATEGWALTPEIAGVSRLNQQGPASGGSTAYVRRRPEPVVVAIGGRNLGAADAPQVRFDLAIDGRPVRSWFADPKPGFFFDMWTLEPGQLIGDGRYALFSVTAEAADGTRRPVAASVEQFDVQPLDGLVYGFGDGWHEQEFSPATGRLWRWSSDQAQVRVHWSGGPLRCVIRGQSPLEDFDRPSRITLRAGDRVLGELEPRADYTWEVDVPADALAAAGGVLTLGTDQTFTPNERSGNGDGRRLGLRIFEFRMTTRDAHTR